jgi:hypothetical protein
MSPYDINPPDSGNLTTEEVNSVQAALEEMADDEFDARSEEFCDWLENNKRIRQDYVQYRVATASEDEVRGAEILLGILR